MILPATPVVTAADLDAAFGARAILVDCPPGDDAVTDAAIELHRLVRELLDVDAADEPGRAAATARALAGVEHLRALGQAVSLAVRRDAIAVRNGGSVPWITIYLAVSRAEPRLAIEVDPRSTLHRGCC